MVFVVLSFFRSFVLSFFLLPFFLLSFFLFCGGRGSFFSGQGAGGRGGRGGAHGEEGSLALGRGDWGLVSRGSCV